MQEESPSNIDLDCERAQLDRSFLDLTIQTDRQNLDVHKILTKVYVYSTRMSFTKRKIRKYPQCSRFCVHQIPGCLSSIHRLCLFSTTTPLDSPVASIWSASRIRELLAGHGSTLEAATVATEPINVRPKSDETNERR